MGTNINFGEVKERKLVFTCDVNYYIKVRIHEPPIIDPTKPPQKYNGEFGFDWVDLDPVSGEVLKIQDVDISEVEYFYKKGATANDLGDIIAKSSDEQGAKDTIMEHYTKVNPCKTVDVPWVLIKPSAKIELSLEVNVDTGSLTNETIYIVGDDFYEFTIVGGTKNGKRTEKKIASDKEKLVLKVECLKESGEKTYKIQQENATIKMVQVGGFTMMENKVLKLKFRVIALVSSDGAPNIKAKALFDKFKTNKIKEYLNENTLNQAGYEVEIENQVMFDNLATADLDDYFYAFDKTDWTNKKLFTSNYNKKYWDKIIKPDGTYELEPDGKHYKMALTDNPLKPIDVITEDNQIDDKVFELYQEKLKKKTPSKSYNGGVIILCDYEAPSQTSAFSRMDPLNHYKLFVYSSSVERKEDYAHEIGHMLGLPHMFFDTKEKEAYKNAKEDILGNREPEKNPDKTKNDKYKAGINKEIIIAENEDTKYQMKIFYSDKKSLTTYLNNFIAYYQGKLKTVNYTDSAKISINGEISKNQKALDELKTVTDCSYKKYQIKCYFLKSDYVKYLERRKQYLEDILEQIKSNVLFYKQNTTFNFMDYYNSRLRFNHNQIKIMRDDSKDFMEEFCKCKAPAKKPVKKK